jgi:hypothetical protein
MITKSSYLSFSLSALLLAVVNTAGTAQTPMAPPPIFEKKIYVDKYKRIYVHKSSPVYLRLTDSNDDKSPSYIMVNEKAKKDTDPAYLDGHGTHHLVHNDAHPKGDHNLSYAVFSDAIPPVTKSLLGGAQRHITQSGIFYGRGLYCELTPSDELSGLQETMYSVNGSTFVPYTGGRLSFNDEKSYNLRFLSYDNVGNMEDVKTNEFIIDLTPPRTTLKVHGTHVDNILAPTAVLSLTPSDQLSGVSRTLYNFDRYNMGAYKGSLELSMLNDGEHTLSYFSEDNVYNRENVSHYNFYLDNTPPVVKSAIEGDLYHGTKTFISPRSRISLSATDNKAGVKQVFYKVNSSVEVEYHSPFFLNWGTGNHVVKYAAIDKVQNISSTSSINLYVDDLPPVTSVSFGTPKFHTRDTLFIHTSTKISISSHDRDESGVRHISYKVDQNPVLRFIDPITIRKSGFHELQFFADDQVNNVETPKKVTFFVDDKPPGIYWNFSTQSFTWKTDVSGQNTRVYPRHTIIYLAATDHHSGLDKIYYTIDNGTEQLYEAPLQNLKPGQMHRISVRALDKLGNESRQSFIFSIE